MNNSKVRVAVLRGGPSRHYEQSLETGKHVLSLLREIPDKYDPVDIFISKDGEWHQGGLVNEPHKTLEYVDIVWNALHGSYGEDGHVQKILEGLKIPFTGSSAVSSALAFNKDMTKSLYQKNDLLTPAYELLNEVDVTDDQLINIFRTYLMPVVVRPVRRTMGMTLVRTFNELKEAVKCAFTNSSRLLIEEFVKGENIHCTVLEKVQGEHIYSFIPTSQLGLRLRVVDHKQIEAMARKAHEVLGLRHYSGSDFVVTPKRIYILNTNSIPALHKDSLTHQALLATGWHPRTLVDHVVQLAR
jgi:D-alanine--D-alanine ligase